MPTFRQDIKMGTKVPQLKTDDINDQAITKDKIRDGNVTTEKLAEGAIQTAKLSDASITTPKIADGNVTTEKLPDAAVTTPKIADQNITTEKLSDQSVTNAKLSPSSVTYDKIKDSSVITEKLNDRAVTTEKLEERAITNPKLGDQSVDGRTIRESTIETKHLANESVTTEKINTQSVTKEKLATDSVDTSKVINGSVTNPKLASASVSTDKLQDRSVTNDKIANDTLTLEKFDADLRHSLEAATGLPDNLLQQIQDISEDIAELKDSEFPMVLSLSTSNDLAITNTTVRYGVTVKVQPFVPDMLDLRKGDTILTNAPVASGSVVSPIQANREVFIFTVAKQGRTTKQVSTTRYLCYYGGNSSSVISASVISTLTKKVVTNVSFNPTVKTQDGDYIWLVVPSYLTINEVTSAGFDVPLASPQTIATATGEFKAYRTVNALTEQTWNLVIS